MELFRRNNVANWAIVEVSKIDNDLKSNVKTCVIGDSRSRLLISNGHRDGWSNRICGNNLDVFDISFGGANLDESFSLLENQIKYLDSLETIIVSVPLDRLLIQKHDINRISTSYFDTYTAGIKYLTDINLVSNIIENKNKILENRNKFQRDTLKLKKDRALGSIKDQNDKIRENKIDAEQIRKRKRIIEFKKERFEKTIKYRDRNAPVDKNRTIKDGKIRKSFLRKFEISDRVLFLKNMDILKGQLSNFAGKYEIILMIPTYDDILYNSIIAKNGEDYKYYIETIKQLPYTIFNLHDISNEFVFVDPVHGNFENGMLIHKINQELTSKN